MNIQYNFSFEHHIHNINMTEYILFIETVWDKNLYIMQEDLRKSCKAYEVHI